MNFIYGFKLFLDIFYGVEPFEYFFLDLDLDLEEIVEFGC